jgi:hypothetical protein
LNPHFPCEEWVNSTDPTLVNPFRHKGMTLRDYFAAKAMQGFFASDTEEWNCPAENFHLRAEAAYKMADAMIKERIKYD